MRVILGFKHSYNKNEKLIKKINNRLIQWWTGSKYFHVEICIDNTWISSSPEKDGVSKHKLKEKKSDNWDYFELPIPKMTHEQQLILCKFINNQLYTGYDWIGIFTQVFRMFRDDSKKWFCSEITTKILQLMYIERLLDKEPSRISPGKLFNLLRRYLIPISGEIKKINYTIDNRIIKEHLEKNNTI